MKKFLFFAFILFLIFGLKVIEGAQSKETFRHSRLEIHSGGLVHLFYIEIAETSKQRSQGLQYRNSLLADHGMLFNFRMSMLVSMWMKNTYIPLDILFISKHGKIMNIVYDTVPLSLNHISAVVPVKGVLELLAGTANRLNIKAGDTVFHPLFVVN